MFYRDVYSDEGNVKTSRKDFIEAVQKKLSEEQRNLFLEFEEALHSAENIRLYYSVYDTLEVRAFCVSKSDEKMLASKGFGNYISFREKDTDNKFELLGENYTEFALRKKIKNQLYEQSKPTQVKSLIDIKNYEKAKDNKGLANWAERTNLQQKMNTLNFLSQQGVSTYEELSEKATAFNSQVAQSGEELKSIETRLKEISALIKDIETYQKTKPTNALYQKVPPKLKAKFYEDNRADLTLFEAANNAISRAKTDTDLPTSRKLLLEKRGEITAQKDKLYAEYMSLKKKSTELNIAKDTMERMLKIDSPEKSSSTKCNNQNLE
ncbi:hypothetical protein FACS1894188_10860 [Clostridia bacterium]|nr:hypothetical protein FACS1894188_10860 [Clostridia bacterium]